MIAVPAATDAPVGGDPNPSRPALPWSKTPDAHHFRPILAATLAAALALAGCSRAAEAPVSAPTAAPSPAAELRLGYFPNITHAPAIIGLANGFFTQELGSTKLTTQTFNAGGDEVSALLGGSLDAGFIGSSPAINAFAKSNGEAVRVIAGSTSGGAAARRLARHHRRPTSSRARSSRRRRRATPRTSR